MLLREAITSDNSTVAPPWKYYEANSTTSCWACQVKEESALNARNNIFKKICVLLKIPFFKENNGYTAYKFSLSIGGEFMKKIAAIIFLVFSIIIITIPVFAFNVDVANVCFSPYGGCTEAIVNQIDNAKSEILIQAYSFTSAVLDLLIARDFHL
jgi:hypothetical protein